MPTFALSGIEYEFAAPDHQGRTRGSSVVGVWALAEGRGRRPAHRRWVGAGVRGSFSVGARAHRGLMGGWRVKYLLGLDFGSERPETYAVGGGHHRIPPVSAGRAIYPLGRTTTRLLPD